MTGASLEKLKARQDGETKSTTQSRACAHEAGSAAVKPINVSEALRSAIRSYPRCAAPRRAAQRCQHAGVGTKTAGDATALVVFLKPTVLVSRRIEEMIPNGSPDTTSDRQAGPRCSRLLTEGPSGRLQKHTRQQAVRCLQGGRDSESAAFRKITRVRASSRSCLSDTIAET